MNVDISVVALGDTFSLRGNVAPKSTPFSDPTAKKFG